MSDRGERGYDGRDGTNGTNGSNGIDGMIPAHLLGDHDLLIRLDQKMDTIIEKQKEGDACMKEHGDRIGRLETFQSNVLAYVAGITLVVSVIGNWILNRFLSGGS